MNQYRRKWVFILTFIVGSLSTYLLFSFGSYLGKYRQYRYLFLLSALFYAAVFVILRWLSLRRPAIEKKLKRFALLSSITLLSLMSLDIAYGIYTHAALPPELRHVHRESDGTLWYAELTPVIFYPTPKNFFIHKPMQKVSGYIYGDYYYPGLLNSPTIVNHVLEKRFVSFSIDAHGFRDTTPIEDAKIFVLGDSFAKGTDTDQPKIWAELLERNLNEPVYNLGIESTSPYQQLMLLEYLIHSKGDSLRMKRLLWLIFEGNDLEDSYEDLSHIEINKRELGTKLSGTMLYPLLLLPHSLEESSILNGIATGRIQLKTFSQALSDPYKIDGIRLIYPLFRSRKYGYCLFAPDQLNNGSMPASYITDHPHRPRLDSTFFRMSSLSAQHGFQVTVLIAPTAPRLYAEYFDGMNMSKKPHFIDYVNGLADNYGFDSINLNHLMKPYAEKEFLYYRDDSHWNERGHQVVAEIIAHKLRLLR